MIRYPLFFLMLSASVAASAEEMMLVCDGAMRGMFKDRSGGAMVVDGKGGIVSGSGSSSAYSDIPTVAQFELKDGGARLNLPQPPTCGICSGEKGWREVRQLSVSDAKIEGKIRYGIMSGTSFEIDRRTGIMTSRNGFTGQCEAQDLARRKF